MVKPDEESNIYLDMPLFYGKFPKFGKYEHEVRGEVHIKEEGYRRYHEIFSLKKVEGTRTYVRMMPYINTPHVIINAPLLNQSQLEADYGAPIAVSSRQVGYDRNRLGIAQAWYHPTDKVIVLWECILYELYRIDDLGIDGNTLKLWTSFEKILLEQFPLAEYMLTTHKDTAYDVEAYQHLLRSLGYYPMPEAQEAWRKTLKNDSL